MKILLVTGNYLPGKNGGIENYTHWLATILMQNNFDVQVAALHVNEQATYFYEGIKVNYLEDRFANFEKLLAKERYTICHFHEYSAYGGIEIPWIEKAKQHCKKVFFTFHLPYLTCHKNDFRYMGVSDCNTFNNPQRCSECVIADKVGYKNNLLSTIILKTVIGIMSISGKKKSLEKRITKNYANLDKLIANCDNLFIYADWFKNILNTNGYDSPKIIKIPYKTKSVVAGNVLKDSSIKNKILFVGRIQHQKGLHLLCKAMNEIETKNISLDVYGNIVDKAYFDNCVKDYSFNFKGTTNYLQLLEELKKYDFLVLPSVFTEMFSLIIKDAFYEQLPVIGSAAKGNKDAIKDGDNGFVFKYNSASDLAKTIDKAYRLKFEGWKPVFSYNEKPENDIREILSYYSISQQGFVLE
ncbi:hypothetical protein BH11BAC5_BH11BAC5_30200 [soil metagenome]